jgi:hypothetical protein
MRAKGTLDEFPYRDDSNEATECQIRSVGLQDMPADPRKGGEYERNRISEIGLCWRAISGGLRKAMETRY